MSKFYAFVGLKLLDLENFDFPKAMGFSVLVSGVSWGDSKKIS